MQLDLFDAPPRQRHSPTSCAAAERVTPHISQMQARLLAWITAHQPCTDNEMIAGGAVSVNGTRARRIELAKAGLIVKDGERNGSTTWRVKGEG